MLFILNDSPPTLPSPKKVLKIDLSGTPPYSFNNEPLKSVLDLLP
jgi:hypothetical protein